MSALFSLCPGDTVQTGTGKVDPARNFKCGRSTRVPSSTLRHFPSYSTVYNDYFPALFFVLIDSFSEIMNFSNFQNLIVNKSSPGKFELSKKQLSGSVQTF